jgi:hypothetical protein
MAVEQSSFAFDTSLGSLAYSELGHYGVLVDVKDIERVADEDAIPSDHLAIDAADLIEASRHEPLRRALRLTGCKEPTWLLVGSEVHLLRADALVPYEMPAFVAGYLRAIGVSGIAAHGDRLSYLLDVRELAMRLAREPRTLPPDDEDAP